MIHYNKHKHIEKAPPGVPIKKWCIAVQETKYVLGHLGTKAESTPMVNSRSVLKAKLAVLEMLEFSIKDNIDEILVDIPKGEINQKPTENQYSIKCPYFVFGNYTKSFCVMKKW